MARLGGPEPHSRRSGVVHVVTDTDAQALAQARGMASLLGDQGTPDPARAGGPDLAALGYVLVSGWIEDRGNRRQVFGLVGIDMIAGPSEILVLADADNDPAWIAPDLLSQAEHDTSAQAILITDDAGFADAVTAAVETHLANLPRSEIPRESWDAFGAVILVERLGDAVALIDRIAPEHLELAVGDADGLAARIRNAGAIFLGRHTPEAVGDYVAGSNHVLPTARSARFSSGLGVLDFMKRTSLLKCGPEQLRALAPAAIALGEAEGLTAHAAAVRARA